MIAAELTAREAPDGYTIFMATAGPVTIAPSLHPKLPYVPLRDLEVPVWAGILVTAGTPAPIVDRIYRESRAALQVADVRKRLAQLCSDVVGDGPQPFGSLLKTDLSRWANVAKAANIRVE